MSKQKAHTWIKDNREYIFIGGCFIFFIFTMLYNLMHSALWGDEWIEYLISQTEIRTGKFYRDVISTFQPPLYNFLMHFWLKMDNSVLWFRSFNVVIGFLSGVCLFGTVNRLTNKYVAGVSVCVLATAYEWVYCIQECSEYALMLFCLFVAVYAYVEVCEKFAYWKMVILILGCVGAVYSQYGSAFVVIPLLGFFYLHNMFSEESCRSRKIVINVSYVISLIIFAIPLYTFFMSKQMENNQIAGHILPFSIECCKEILIKLGQIIGYFFQQTTGVWAWFWSAFGIALIIISVVLVFKKTINWTRLSLIFSMWFAYILHYFLVQLHIYAMAHANQSSGFFCRYSYFYIPLLCVVIPVCCYEIFKVASKSMKTLMVALGTVGAICMCVSLHSLLGNWHKSLDDVYAQIWIDERGWEDTTYLFGTAIHGFKYYVSQNEAYQDGYLENATMDVDMDYLPERFWAWRTNWNGDGWNLIVEKARELGYEVVIYDDSGYTGQLAHCVLRVEQE